MTSPTSLIVFWLCFSSTVVKGLSTSSSAAAPPSTSVWKDVPMGPPDAILGIAQAFRECTNENKVNVCVGAYRDATGTPCVLPSVRKAEEILLEGVGENKEYLPIDGDAVFVDKALRFAYGAEAPLERIAGAQSLSGTGACKIGGDFLAQFWPGAKRIFVPNPTWGNHLKIFAGCGLEVEKYRYYDRTTNYLDFDGLMEDLREAPPQSIVLLHACAHNPTGCDPTLEQWSAIFDLCIEKGHMAFFDSAYQGFASGDSEKDAQALRLALSKDMPGVMLAQSFAKNFGLYGERCGTLSIVANSPEEKEIIQSQLKCIIRPNYSSPPKHGSSIVRTVLSDEELTQQYYEECANMASRIQEMRQKLVAKLAQVGSTHDWSHVTSQIGMFAFTGMSQDMCEQLTDGYSIFLTKDGRISIAGLNDSNLEYVATAIHAVTDGKSITA